MTRKSGRKGRGYRSQIARQNVEAKKRKKHQEYLAKQEA